MIKFIVFWVALRIAAIPCSTEDIYNPHSIGPPPYHNACFQTYRDSFVVQFDGKDKLDDFMKNALLRNDIDTLIVRQVDSTGVKGLESGKIYYLNRKKPLF